MGGVKISYQEVIPGYRVRDTRTDEEGVVLSVRKIINGVARLEVEFQADQTRWVDLHYMELLG